MLREVSYIDIKHELAGIGFDSSYLNVISEKFRYKNIKIYNLSSAQANILKQTALIFGADCAVNRNVVTGKAEVSDAILCGSYSQLYKIALKLKVQPFKLGQLACDIQDFLRRTKRSTQLVGILNITPDSFSDGGKYIKPREAEKKLQELIVDGADIIDIGAESTRPFAEPVEADEQILRLSPILKFIQKENINIRVSVDTRSSVVADFALNNGVQIINDVSGFDFDSKMPEIIAKYNAGVVIQHSKGKPEDIPVYENVVDEIYLNLKDKIELAKSFGISNIIIDPGIGFGKSRDDNFKILDNIKTFCSLGCPVMAGLSRKRFLNAENCDNALKDSLTLAFSYPLIQDRIDYLRVHNVKMHKQLLKSLPT